MTSDENKQSSTSSRKPCVTILVGLIGSGKSTLARPMSAGDPNAVRINNDDVVEMLEGDYKRYRHENRQLYKQVELNMVATALALQYDLVIDRTNLTKVQRRRFISLAETFGAKEIIAVVAPVEPFAVHLDRRMEEPKGYSRDHWRKVLELHWDSAEPVELAEGFTEIVDHSGGQLVGGN